MVQSDFAADFKALTGYPPFPWQRALYERFIADKFPDACIQPTGLGKTSIMAVWLLALAKAPAIVPRRLVYVVNRRTVVDQSTDEAEKLRLNLSKAPAVRDALMALTAVETKSPLAISTLRGQFADNAEWRDDPARPAIIAGTVDMIGSRLLFAGYGCGYRSRPLHAALLGQDVLLVHDEAHLEQPFQKLLMAVQKEQGRRRSRNQKEQGHRRSLKRFHVLQLTATSREAADPFVLTEEDRANSIVKSRIEATKQAKLHAVEEDKLVGERVATLALDYKDSGKAILVFLRTLKDVNDVQTRLLQAKAQIQLLTGTIRGYERDRLTTKDDIFARFLPESNRGKDIEPRKGTVYLLCTSAGEVGVNISADHLVCDLTPFDSMAQRFGRVNRFGEGAAMIDIVYPATFAAEPDYEVRRGRTLELLRRLPSKVDRHSVCPAALETLPEDDRRAAFTPTPDMLETSEILFDAWALTTVRDPRPGQPLPGRPPVADWLHGVETDSIPETLVAWRNEVELLPPKVLKANKLDPDNVLEMYPLKPHELLRDRTDRVFKHLEGLAKAHASAPVWVVDLSDSVDVTTLGDLVAGGKDDLNGRTVLLPPAVGGLTPSGSLGAGAPPDQYDVADEWRDEKKEQRRKRTRPEEEPPGGMRLVMSIERTDPEDDDVDTEVWNWYVRPKSADDESGEWSSRTEQDLPQHLEEAGRFAALIVQKLGLPEPLASAVTLAANSHDLGKRRKLWQNSIGNREYPKKVLAKSGHSRPPEKRTGYRHEFGSVQDVSTKKDFRELSPDMKDLVLHLIAAHHGRARPYFPAKEAFDPENLDSDSLALALEVPRRYARLQRGYGRWGLAYLESLVRASDYLASEDTP